MEIRLDALLSLHEMRLQRQSYMHKEMWFGSNPQIKQKNARKKEREEGDGADRNEWEGPRGASETDGEYDKSEGMKARRSGKENKAEQRAGEETVPW